MTALRDPAPAELDVIYRLGRDVWGEGLSEAAYLDACRGSDKYRRGTWHVVGENGRVVSALIVYGDGFGLPAGCHGIGSIATAVDERGRGHASRLLGGVLAALEASGSSGAFLFADIETSLYLRHGFVEIGREHGSSCLWRPFDPGGPPPSTPGYF